MTRRVLRLSALALFLLAAPAAHAQDFFTGGIDLGGGPWLSMAPTTLANDISSFCATGGTCATSKADVAAEKSLLNIPTVAKAATQPFNGQMRGDLTLHLGWMHVDPKWGRFDLEGAYQAPGLNPFGAINTSTGAGSFIQVRLSWFFLRMIDPDTNFDLGIEGGGGSALLGDDHFFQLDGGSAEVAVRALYYLSPYVSVEAYYRFTALFLTTFYSHYSENANNDAWETLYGFTSGLNELGIGINVYLGSVPKEDD